MIEPLEARIAPASVATLLNTSTILYSDVDGDNVTIHISKPIFTIANANAALVITPHPARADGSIPVTLDTFDVTKLGAAAEGLSLSITASVSKTHGGNGQVDVGAINGSSNALNLDLGSVVVQGDLGSISCGTGSATVAGLHSLSAYSISNVTPGTDSVVSGTLGSVSVRGNLEGGISATNLGTVVVGGSLESSNGVLNGLIATASTGSIGHITIHKNVNGAYAAGTTPVLIYAPGAIESIVIGGSLLGGASGASATITSGGKIGSIAIGGSVIGGAGPNSGSIQGGAGIGAVSIGHDVTGGSGQNSGAILSSFGPITSVRIGGSVVGGSNTDAGEIVTEGSGGIGAVVILGSLKGGSVAGTGDIASNHDLARVYIGGDLLGGTAGFSGRIVAQGKLGPVTVLGSVSGQAHQDSGVIFSRGGTASVTIGGNLEGLGLDSGSIYSAGAIGTVRIGGDLVGGNINSNISAGADNKYGTADDTLVGSPSRIASIIIAGTAEGDGIAGDHFGIEAATIGYLKVGPAVYSAANPSYNYANGFTLDSPGAVTVRTL